MCLSLIVTGTTAESKDECGVIPPSNVIDCDGTFTEGIIYGAVASGATVNVGKNATTNITKGAVLVQGTGDLVLNTFSSMTVTATKPASGGGLLVSQTQASGSSTLIIDGSTISATGSGAEAAYSRNIGANSVTNPDAVLLSASNTDIYGS